MNLKEGSSLQGGRYVIKRVLGAGGFGITYLAEQTGLCRKVAIKEFFMKEFCVRDSADSSVSVPTVASKEVVDKFKAKFIKEARNIAALRHKNIISVVDIFEENGTAYYVMEFLQGGSLSDKLAGGALPEAVAVAYIRQVASALECVHQNKMMHLDVKPANILIDNEGNAVLIDFGLSKRYDDLGRQTSTTPVGISAGYAPMEQYKPGGVGVFTPATDIYSLGATLFKLVTGTTPPDASDVFNEGLPDISQSVSPNVKQAIVAAMMPGVKARPQSISQFLALLGDTGKVAPIPLEVCADDFVDVEPVAPKDVAPACAEAEETKAHIDKEVTAYAGKSSVVAANGARITAKVTPQKKNSKNTLWIVLLLLLILVAVTATVLFVVGGDSSSQSANNRSRTGQRKESLNVVANPVVEATVVTEDVSVAEELPVSAVLPESEEVHSSSAAGNVGPNPNGVENGKINTDSNRNKSDYADVADTDVADTEIVVAEEEVEEEEVYQVVEHQPEFPGGVQALYQFLSNNINYPAISRQNGSQGRVFVRFVVNTDGSISGAEVIKSSGDVYLDREAVRLVSSMPRWKPGMQSGKAVKVYFTLPVSFKLV